MRLGLVVLAGLLPLSVTCGRTAPCSCCAGCCASLHSAPEFAQVTSHIRRGRAADIPVATRFAHALLELRVGEGGMGGADAAGDRGGLTGVARWLRRRAWPLTI
ncbi:hypothetical protein GCM10023097_29270 [Streptomyces collinus]